MCYERCGALRIVGFLFGGSKQKVNGNVMSEHLFCCCFLLFQVASLSTDYG